MAVFTLVLQIAYDQCFSPLYANFVYPNKKSSVNLKVLLIQNPVFHHLILNDS